MDELFLHKMQKCIKSCIQSGKNVSPAGHYGDGGERREGKKLEKQRKCTKKNIIFQYTAEFMCIYKKLN